MVRGKRADALPDGERCDTRRHTRHVLRPTRELVDTYLANPTDGAWLTFRSAYLELLATRFAGDRTPFDDLAERARDHDVYLGCSCPSKANPTAGHCHTYPALEFMRQHYPDLEIRA